MKSFILILVAGCALALPAFAQTKQLTPDQVKELDTSYSELQLNELAVEAAVETFVASDPVSQKAQKILKAQVDKAPEVVKSRAEFTASLKALKDKIIELKKAQGLDDSYDWDFSKHVFVQRPQPPAKPGS